MKNPSYLLNCFFYCSVHCWTTLVQNIATRSLSFFLLTISNGRDLDISCFVKTSCKLSIWDALSSFHTKPRYLVPIPPITPFHCQLSKFLPYFHLCQFCRQIHVDPDKRPGRIFFIFYQQVLNCGILSFIFSIKEN